MHNNDDNNNNNNNKHCNNNEYKNMWKKEQQNAITWIQEITDRQNNYWLTQQYICQVASLSLTNYTIVIAIKHHNNHCKAVLNFCYHHRWMDRIENHREPVAHINFVLTYRCTYLRQSPTSDAYITSLINVRNIKHNFINKLLRPQERGYVNKQIDPHET